jgi:phosphate transport system protein
MERHFDIQLEKLKTKIIKMCSVVDEQVEFALRLFDDLNPELAKLIIERDKKVDKYDVKIEKICQRIFALNQPVAMDLRMIMSALTINTNLERIGDITVNIAESSLLLKTKPEFFSRTKLAEMGSNAKEMIKSSIDSYIEGSSDLAQKVIKADDIVDNLNRENHKILIEIMKEDPENIEPGVVLLGISKHLERMGDHATNIAEDVFFITEAQVIKHKYEKYLIQQEEQDDEDDDRDEVDERL